MASWFDDEALSLNNILDEFGERFQIRPHTTRPNFSPTPDPSRAVVEVRLAFERDGKQIKLGMEQMSVVSRDPCMTGLACEMPYAIGRGDQLLHIDTKEVFEITSAVPDGLSGIKFETVQVGKKAS